MDDNKIYALSFNPKEQNKPSKLTVEWVREIFLLLVAALCIFPLIWMFSTSLKSTREAFTSFNIIPQVWRFDNYVNAWQQANFSLYFLNSIIYTVTVMLGVWFIATLGAYGFARLEIPGKKVIFYILVGSLMVPIPGSFIPLYVMMNKYHLAGTRLGYILPMISGGLATSIFILKSFFEGIPKEFEESARIDGCSKAGIFFRIMVPLARPAWLTAMIFTALATWNDYFWAVIMFNRKELMPIQVGLKVFQGQYFTKYEMVMAGAAIAAIPVILLYIAFQKYIVSGLTAGGVKG
ncbi:MAG TPA: carbohydrate ABC transporter permease [Bacillota bacterium]|nr:carbohydrate ABC transporter permease [Bacillota bacterium]